MSNPPAAPTIRRLPADVVARIAAGEVIERPASVVKELFENSLDAGATQITVEIEGAVDRMVRISDDGHGMTGDGIHLALERHATSKITDADDLFRISTLGFRGEGLASVAAVSRLVIVSATDDSEGSRVEAEGGEIRAGHPAARSRGTTIEVRDLFFNTPARRKFQRAVSTELQTVARTLQSYALIRPDLHLRYVVDSREILNLPPAGGLAERMTAIFGRERTGRMIPVEASNRLVTMSGYLGAPEDSRARSDQQTWFINGRLVSNPLLRQAVRQAYGNLLPFDRHPFAVLAIVIDPARVDVNVHPTKKEVRFSSERDLFPALVAPLRQAVLAHVPSFTTAGPAGEAAAASREEAEAMRRQGVRDLAELFGAPSGESVDSRGGAGDDVAPIDEPGLTGPLVPPIPAGEATVLPLAFVGSGGAGVVRESPPVTGDEPAIADLWQLHRTYIFASIRGGLLIIDQHAAHERVLFEEAMLRLRGQRATAQELLFPQVVDLTAEEFHILLDVQPTIEKLGFHIELFGGTTVVVHGIPAGLTRWRQGDLLHDMIAMYGDLPGGPPVEERVARSYACRSAVKSGEPLTAIEMNELVDRLFATRLPQGDPHGRPTFLRLSIGDLHRRFGRSG